MTSRMNWDIPTLLIGIGGTLFFVTGMIYLYINSDYIGTRILAMGVMLIYVFQALRTSPIHVTVTAKELIIKKIWGQTIIRAYTIIDAASVPDSIIRKSRNGDGKYRKNTGCFGYIGEYKNSQLGLYMMYAMEKKNLMLITVKEGEGFKKIIISCQDSQKIADYIKSRIGDS